MNKFAVADSVLRAWARPKSARRDDSNSDGPAHRWSRAQGVIRSKTNKASFVSEDRVLFGHAPAFLVGYRHGQTRDRDPRHSVIITIAVL
jgi:hypothetical protein